MSRTIDDEVVKLEFDNSKFESNVKDSMSTLDKLKEKLKFKGATKGLDEIEKASSKMDFSHMSNGIESLSLKFDSLGVIGYTVLQNLTNKVVDFGLQLAKSASIDQVAAGWSKMDQMTGSVQTLVNSTGKSVDEITSYLEKLMWYSDETSFGFTDMTAALATMTSSGGDIEKLIPMIEGIANATAYAGKGAAEFSRVIYNLNQSYSAGALTLMDWKSVQGAGVNSKALMETLISTAEELGKIQKGTVTLGNFTETLKNKWADTEVMEVAFNKFAVMTEEAYKLVEAGEFVTASKAYEALSGQFDEIAERAAKSAQEAKTFKEAIDSVKDAVSSKWLNIFSTIFGDYNQQKETWTNLANDLWEIFAAPLDDLNEILTRSFATSKWELFAEGLSNSAEVAGIKLGDLDEQFIKFIKDTGSLTTLLNGEEWSKQIDSMIEEAGSLSDFLSSGWIDSSKYAEMFFNSLDKQSGKVSDIGSALEQIQKIYDDLWIGKYGYKDSKDRIDKLTEAGIDYATAQGLIYKMLENGHGKGYKLLAEDIAYLSEEQLINMGLTLKDAESIKTLSQAAKEANVPIDKLINSLGKKTGQELLSETLSNLTTIILNLKTMVGNAWSKVFDSHGASNAIYSIIEAINKFTTKIKDLTSDSNILTNALTSIFSILKTGKNIIEQLVRGTVSIAEKLLKSLNIDIGEVSTSIGDVLKTFSDWIVNSDAIFNILDSFGDKLANFTKAFVDWINSIRSTKEVTNIIDTIKSSLSNVSDFFKNIKFGKIDTTEVTRSMDNISRSLASAPKAGLKEYASSVENTFTNITEKAKSVGAVVSNAFNTVIDKFKELKVDGQKILSFLEETITTLIGLFTGVTVVKAIEKIATACETLLSPLATFDQLLKSVQGFFGAGKNLFNAGIKYIDQLTNNIKTDNFLKITIAIGALLVALWALTKIDSAALWEALAAIGALLIMITVAAKSFAKMPDLKLGAKDFAAMVLSMAGSVVILAIAVQMLKNLTSPQLGAGIGGVLFLVGILAGSIILITKKAGEAIVGAKTIIAFAASVFMLAISMKLIATMGNDANEWAVAFIGLGLCVGALIAMAWAMNEFPGATVAKAGTQMIAFAASILVLAIAMKALAAIGSVDYLIGLARLVPIFAIFTTIAYVMKGAQAQIVGLGGTILAMSASIILIVVAIKMIRKIDFEDLLAAGAIVTRIMIFLTICASVISYVSGFMGTFKQLAGLGVVMLGLSASLFLFVGAILIIKNLNKEDIWSAALVLSMMMLAMGGAIALMNLTKALNQTNAYGAKVITSFALVVVALGAALVVLSSLDQTRLWSSVLSLTLILAALSACFVAMSLLAKQDFGKMMQSMLGMGLVLAGAVGALVVLDNFTGGEDIIQKALALSAIMGTMAAVAAVLSVAGIAAQAAGPGLGYILAFMVALEAIIGVTIGLASQVDPALIDNAITVLTKIGEALGGFFGGIISNFISTATSTLPQVAQNLSDFMTNLSGFFDKMKEIPDNAAELFQSVIDVIMNFGSSSSQRALNYLSKNTIDFTNIGKFLTDYADVMIAFSNKLGEGNFSAANVEAAAQAGQMMTELYDTIPKEGGVWGSIKEWWSGTTSLEDFGNQIKAYAQSLVEMSDIMTAEDGGFKPEAVDAAAVAGKTLIELANALPNNGPIMRLFQGNKDLAVFGAELKPFAQGLLDLCTLLSGKDENGNAIFSQKTIDNAKTAGETLAGFAESLPKQDSIKAIFTGETGLASFGGEIADYAEGVVRLCEVFADGTYDAAVVEKAATAGQSLKAILDNMPADVDIEGAIKGVGEKITTGMTEMMNGVVKLFDRYDDAQSNGRHLLEGLLSGLTDSELLRQVYLAGVNVAETFNKAFKSNIKINSPSKVMEENGENTIQGLIDGVYNKIGDLATTGKEAVNTLTSALQTSVDLAKDTLSDSLNPVITPVLDLSEIQNGASRLSGMLNTSDISAKVNSLGSAFIGSNNNLAGADQVHINLNNTFDIQNGQNIDRETVRGWTDWIFNDINEKLGKVY